MSFRLFIYYCALCGGWFALIGWVLGRGVPDELKKHDILVIGIQGFLLGLLVSFGLGVVDSLWNLSPKQIFQAGLRVLIAVIIGSIGGMIGAMTGQWLYGLKEFSLFLIIGWTLTGMLIGVSVGVFDILLCFSKQEDISGAVRKSINGMIGGTVGGMLGGILFLQLKIFLGKVFTNLPEDQASDLLWSPGATGFVILGMCIGLLIGLAQVMLKEAWVKVESGRRAGKEMILSKQIFTIGRAESCDLGLFGDMAVDKVHAKIVRKDNGYVLADAGTAGGTFVNGKKINGPTPITSGDSIRVGGCVLRFGERQKKSK